MIRRTTLNKQNGNRYSFYEYQTINITLFKQGVDIIVKDFCLLKYFKRYFLLTFPTQLTDNSFYKTASRDI